MSKPLTNCHTHIFTGDYVPPFLGKCYLPLGLWWILRTPLIINVFRFWYNNPRSPYKWKFTSRYKKISRMMYYVKMAINRNPLLRGIIFIIATIICINGFFILYDWLNIFYSSNAVCETSILKRVSDVLVQYNIILTDLTTAQQITFVLIIVLFIKTGRNLIFFLLKYFLKFFSLLPGKQTLAYIKRYINIGRFAFYTQQKKIFEQLSDQYPPDTRFVVLPMDMEYMGAGVPKKTYAAQLEELADIKESNPDNFLPFIFIDPRRISNDPTFFKYSINNQNDVVLEDCTIREYVEKKQFSGFKIYPALGYYPFEKELLPLWKYAAQHEIPILTHCIRGTIFYRGPKKREWDVHPHFKEDDTSTQKLLLPQTKNEEFSVNFTHPLNYLCLLKEILLRKMVAESDDDVKRIFGYTRESTPLKKDLNNLKICFGHFGGDDEWQKYWEADRDQYSDAVLQNQYGIDFLKNSSDVFSNSKLAQIWKNTDWHSIICSIMLQHPNVYSDISYIIHNPNIWPLLQDTLSRIPLPEGARRLSSAVLFGTDFYVVRNHKSEKQLLAELEHNLSVTDVEQIAVKNPATFLTRI